MRTPHWPVFGLRVRTPRLELQYVDDVLANELAELSLHPIHDPETMPFSVPWTDIPAEARARQSLQHFWGGRAAWTVDDWRCPMAVIIDGHTVGAQDVGATHFRVTKSVTTGSWLTQTMQGQGIGKEMRAAILHLAFEGLGAQWAHTAAYHDNLASLGVTRALGYEPNGEVVEPRRDGADLQYKFLMSRERWLERRRDDIEIEGLGPCLDMFGATSS